jgi:hypothetical protein
MFTLDKLDNNTEKVPDCFLALVPIAKLQNRNLENDVTFFCVFDEDVSLSG